MTNAHRTRRTTAAEPVAEICLYGRTDAAGYLARTRDGRMFGTGEPVAGRILTEATWNAADELRAAGVTGVVRIFDPTGESCADYEIGSIPWFGMIEWQPAPVYVLSAAELLKHATVVR